MVKAGGIFNGRQLTPSQYAFLRLHVLEDLKDSVKQRDSEYLNSLSTQFIVAHNPKGAQKLIRELKNNLEKQDVTEAEVDKTMEFHMYDPIFAFKPEPIPDYILAQHAQHLPQLTDQPRQRPHRIQTDDTQMPQVDGYKGPIKGPWGD